MGRLLCKIVVACSLAGAAPSYAGQTIKYTYDAKGRVKTVTRTGPGALKKLSTYTLDKSNNRSTLVIVNQ